MPDALNVFDRRTVRRHRDRAAGQFGAHDFLVTEVGGRLLDRFDDIRRRFPFALDLGCHTGQIQRMLAGHGGIQQLVQCDVSSAMVAAADGLRVICDDELLPFADGSFDCVISLLSLHWINDLPGTLLQIRRALKPDGLLLAAILGGQTLTELRQSLAEAEIAVEGGLSPRVSPFADVRDIGYLLQRAGFALPTVDTETLTVWYGHPLKLMHDLRGMGETNAVLERRRTLTRRQTLAAAIDRYTERLGDSEGRVPATFQVIYLTAWAPDPSQPQPLRPGSAQKRLADALGTVEIPAADPTGPAGGGSRVGNG